MNSINAWLKIIANNEIHAYNKVSGRNLAICFNFLQIPDTETIAMTVTIMKNKIKKNSLNPTCFARVMGCIESALHDTDIETEDRTDMLNEYYVNLKSSLSALWYTELCCHRVFFIPVSGLFSTIKNLFNQDNIVTMKDNDIEEVAVYVNTENYDFNAKFY